MFHQFVQSHWVGSYPFTKPVPLNSKPSGLALSLASGIYALYCPNPLTGNTELAYIGQADSLGNRVSVSHHAIQQMMKQTGCWANQIYVAFHIEPNQVRRNQIEQELIRQFQPKYNVQHTGLGSLLQYLVENQQKRSY